ncbi:MAG: Gfo/Idh/MocA family oxidoreductase [Phycisphaeraceae bacterium]|nr:Gfo/Idh/MocA family oxidoreductase [Phycisphaeraceae bacterium]
MKKTIGFIDEFLDNWHANNYPQFIRDSALGKDFQVTLAWELRAPATGLNIDQWCAKQKIAKARSIEQVVAECDCLLVLAPRNAAVHEQLADLPLRSGKPVYIDKPFAPSLAAGRRMFEKAGAYKTPMFSSSALRFGSALQKALAGPLADKSVDFVSVRGSGEFVEYAIHQLEMLVMTLGLGACRVMHVGNATTRLLLVDYPDGRRGTIQVGPGLPFQLAASWVKPGGGGLCLDTMDDFFPRFIDAMLVFYNTRQPQAPPNQTLEIAALLEAGVQALARPGEWVNVPKA